MTRTFSLLAICALAAGCASGAKMAPALPAASEQQQADARAKTALVQQALLVFVDQFIPAISEGCDYIVRNSKSTDAKISAQQRKIMASLAALKNAANPNPYAGLLDQVVMVTLLSDVIETSESKTFFGPEGQRLSAVLLIQKKQIWTVASQFVTESQQQELRDSIKSWQDANPQHHYVSFVRIGQLPETRQIQNPSQNRRPNSVFGLLFLDPLANLDPAVREFEMSRQLVERAFFYLQRMPIIVSWQTEMLYSQMLAAPEVQQTMASVSTFTGSTTRFSGASQQFADTIERFRTDVPRLRDDSVKQLEQAVARQRESAITQATTQISAERDAAIRQLGATVRTEQRELSGGMLLVLNQASDHLFWRVVVLCAAVFIGAIAYRLIFRRIQPGHSATTTETSSSKLRQPAQVSR
jgi:hypothetical protein